MIAERAKIIAIFSIRLGAANDEKPHGYASKPRNASGWQGTTSPDAREILLYAAGRWLALAEQDEATKFPKSPISEDGNRPSH